MPDHGAGLTGSVVSVVSPGAYCVSDGAGDIAAAEEGFFYGDTRHLSWFVLRVNGVAAAPRGYRTRGSGVEFCLGVSGGVEVVRRRRLGDGMEEEIELRNGSPGPVDACVALECAADFEDVFAVRGNAKGSRRGEVSR